MDPEQLRKGTPAGDASLESGSTRSPRSPRRAAPRKQFPRPSGGGDGAAGAAVGFPQLILARTEESSPKAFQELDPGSALSQLMLALQIAICPNRSEAGRELSFILAIVRCFWLLLPR